MALSKEEKEFALNELDSYIEENKLDYADNYRFADLMDEKENQEYETKQKRGYCGQFDWEVHFKPTNKRIRIGCNYGH